MKKIYSIKKAASLLRAGCVIAYPTETFYAVGCSVYDEQALHRIFKIKERAAALPLPLIVRDFEQITQVGRIDAETLPYLEEVTSLFWPSSLSILLRAKICVSPCITAGTGNIVVRQSPHPTAQELMQEIDFPLVSTSANKSGESAAGSLEELDKKLHLDAVLCTKYPLYGELPSTIIEVLQDRHFRVIRQGAFSLDKLKDIGYTEIATS